MKKLRFLLLPVVTMIALTANAVIASGTCDANATLASNDTRSVVITGSCGADGDDVTYTLYDDGEFVFSGKGKVGGYYTYNTSPWESYKDQIKTAVINEGVTNVYYCAFNNCNNLTSVSIPSSVTEIGNAAFEYCSLTTVSIPESVTEIGNYAFGGNKLTSVVIPNSVKKMGYGAFQSNRELTSVTISNALTELNYYTFKSCEKLTTVVIPNSVTKIGKQAFSGCTSLTSVVMPEKLTEIEGEVFEDCVSLTAISIPNTVKEIGERAFYNNSNLASITLSNSITKISANTFYDCRNLSKIVVPNSVTTIENNAFENCFALILDIPASVTSIGDDAFKYVPNVSYTGTIDGSPWGARYVNGFVDGNMVYSDNAKTKLVACSRAIAGDVEIPNTVKEIGNRAFYFCENITSLTIPASVTTIDDYAFAVCHENMKDIYCYATTLPSTTAAEPFTGYRSVLHVPFASLQAYKTTKPWSFFSSIVSIEKMVTEITLSETSYTLEPGDTFTLKATVAPADADNTSVTWTSSDTSVATVDSNGKVTCVGGGSAVISCTAADGSGVKASCVLNCVDGIITVTTDTSNAAAVYGTDGAKRDGLHQGINIVVTKEGKPVKVVKK